MKFNKYFKGQLKRAAQDVFPLVAKREKLNKKITELQAEVKEINDAVEKRQLTIREATGYSVEDLIERTVVDTGKLDKKTGKPIKVTKYDLKYPETVVPPVEIEHDGEHHLMNDEGNELPIMTKDVFDPTENVNFDGNNPNMI